MKRNMGEREDTVLGRLKFALRGLYAAPFGRRENALHA